MYNYRLSLWINRIIKIRKKQIYSFIEKKQGYFIYIMVNHRLLTKQSRIQETGIFGGEVEEVKNVHVDCGSLSLWWTKDERIYHFSDRSCYNINPPTMLPWTICMWFRTPFQSFLDLNFMNEGSFDLNFMKEGSFGSTGGIRLKWWIELSWYGFEVSNFGWVLQSIYMIFIKNKLLIYIN